MTELLTAQNQDNSEYLSQHPDAVIDEKKARLMAEAMDRNETNRKEFARIALAHMASPDERTSSLRASITAVEGNTFSSTDPSVRIVKAKKGGYAYEYTADSAIAEAQKERAEADRRGQIASDRYDALKNL